MKATNFAIMIGCFSVGLLVSPLTSIPPEAPEVNIDLQPLYDEVEWLKQENEILMSKSELNEKFIDERCVCMVYDFGPTTNMEPKTKKQVCSAPDEKLFYWRGGL